MTLSGPQAIKAIDEALKDIRREESEITRRIARATERVGKLRETELGQLRALATVRLSPEAQEDLTGRMSRAESRARDMLRQHGKAMADLEATLAQKDTALAALSSERAAALETIAAKQGEIEALHDQVATALRSNSAHADAQKTLEELSRKAEEADKKADQAEADRDAKGKPYRDDPLFIYLWEAGYGTSAYKAGNLTRLFDGMVARLVRYQDARPNYAMLNEIPERLREHADRLAEDVGEAHEQLAAIELTALDSVGGKGARETIAQLEARIGAIDTEIVGIEDEREQLTAEQKQHAEGGDPTSEEAVSLLAEAISGTDIAQLLEDARQTGTAEDDTIVAKIDDTRRRIGEDEAELDRDRTRLQTLESRRRELEDIEYEFKRSRFDDPQSRFREDRLAGDFLNDFLKGAITASAYWGLWRQSQDWAWTSGPIVPPRSGGPGRSSSGSRGTFPPLPGGFGGMPGPIIGGGSSGGSGKRGGSSGGFSRPRSGGFKTGGGFKGGRGFKTGGGF